jgi:hypothetical protein
MGSTGNTTDAGNGGSGGLDRQLTASFARLCARPIPVAMLDLVAALDEAFPAVRRERALDDA